MNKSCASDKATPFLSETQKYLVNELWEFYILPFLNHMMRDEAWIYTGCVVLLEILNNKDKALIKAMADEFYTKGAVRGLQILHCLVSNETPKDDRWLVAVLDVRLGHNPKFIEEERREIAQMIHDSIYQWLLSKFPEELEIAESARKK